MKKFLKACLKAFIFVGIMYLVVDCVSSFVDIDLYQIDLAASFKDVYVPMFVLIVLLSYVYSYSKINVNHMVLRKQKEEVYRRLSDSDKKRVDSMDFVERETFLYKKVQEVIANEGEQVFEPLKKDVQENAKVWNRKVTLIRTVTVIFTVICCTSIFSTPLQAANELQKRYDERQIYLDTAVADGPLYIEGYPEIILSSNGTFTNRDVEKIVNDILPSQPKGLVVLPSRITFMSDEVWLQNNPDKYCGFAHSADYSIEVRMSGYEKTTVTHECAHILDFMYGYSTTPTMLAFYQENPTIVREYGGTNTDEFFAVGAEAYFWNEGDIDKDSPYYQYLNEVFAPFK